MSIPYLQTIVAERNPLLRAAVASLMFFLESFWHFTPSPTLPKSSKHPTGPKRAPLAKPQWVFWIHTATPPHPTNPTHLPQTTCTTPSAASAVPGASGGDVPPSSLQHPVVLQSQVAAAHPQVDIKRNGKGGTVAFTSSAMHASWRCNQIVCLWHSNLIKRQIQFNYTKCRYK